MKLIDKDKIAAELEKRYEYWREKEFNSHSIESEIRMSECQHLMLLLNNLKAKQVNLEKEFYDFLDTLIGKDNGRLSEDELFRIAEYFYELGVKSQKRE